VKFQRTVLIDQVNTEIARRQQAIAERNAKAQQEHEQRRSEHVEATSAAWQTLAATIRKRVSKGLPVTDEDIPTELRNGRGGYVRTFSDREPGERVANTQALTTLLDLLKASTDDEVTDTSLQRMGFRMGDLFPGH
jgi:hypothetical protein